MFASLLAGAAIAAVLAYLVFRYVGTKRIAAGLKSFEAALEIERKKLAASLEAERQNFHQWRQREEANLDLRAEKMAAQIASTNLQQWKLEEEGKIRADAIMRSGAITKGKVLEHFVSFMSAFNYHPSDARFLGSPVDLVVFDGLTDGELKAVRFLEVKTSKSRLTGREEKIKTAIMEGRVSWEEIRID